MAEREHTDWTTPGFQTMWQRFDDLELVYDPTSPCPYAQAFFNWGKRELNLGRNADLIEVNQAKVLLLDKYFEFYCVIPKQHRYRVRPEGHMCVFHVFIEFYQRIKQLQLSLSPPMLFIPPPPPEPPPPPQLAGLFFGEVEEE